MITFSLCMIVKNEESVLGRILEPMREIADEIILVDTGSSDRTKEIAGKYTEKIFDYPWQQDFAAARNFACSRASCQYWMWLDADDMITPDNQKKLLRLKQITGLAELFADKEFSPGDTEDEAVEPARIMR